MKSDHFTVSIEEAREIILNMIKPLGFENVSIIEAYNRVLYEDIVSNIMLPPLDDSAMDGYAVIADDTKGATKDNPIILNVIGEIQAGFSSRNLKVVNGTAIRIMTGAHIPEGADAVVKFEDTEEDKGFVKLFREATRYEHYRFAGESIKKGDCVLQKGDRLNSADVGILASLNHNRVKVYKQPSVSIISTGDELADIGDEIQFGQIRNVNAYTLSSEVRKYGIIPHYLGIVKDNPEDTKTIFLEALKSDVVISTGGVSMGRYDFVKEIYKDLDIEVKFEWIKVKPGRPCTFGTKKDTLIFGLPGNPVSTLTSFIQFVRPALLCLMGAKRIKKPVVNAILEEDINKKPGRAYLLRGYFTIKNNEFYVSTTGNQKSSVLRSMSDANCLIRIPEDVTKMRAGERATIELIEHGEI
ncbi:MAG TPA: molybdopterin molybdotransferase MoeA [Syntrophorhabdaceae bacterium]|jgi:molybdopterin molybdotransferase|nr:molybdopterin molybdotransferase MoeA [Syntrophorhabdaceae bacterium]MDI9561781.1 molybdopterin molybdotransferase MoeA [Pseudomonadota bacterium]MBP8697994.1 molybdopterin molybdotransferase MoeA [Syntrophorhabdaceae bacterium]HPH42123.1 molybdopterin molybdotransferase MoeA [Syntrophorhabdaceae bacterium]HPN97053.1 molybdopterin molybdotransferase MoeA [Syntrophorhabdaceae bacterium]